LVNRSISYVFFLLLRLDGVRSSKLASIVMYPSSSCEGVASVGGLAMADVSVSDSTTLLRCRFVELFDGSLPRCAATIVRHIHTKT
jgi:hypothetical protein